MTWPGEERAAVAARGHMRASHADREHVIDTLKAAYVQGRLSKDEFDARVGRTLTSRTYAELAAVSGGIPAAPPTVPPPRPPSPRRVSSAARWGTSGFLTPAILAAAFACTSLRGDGKYGVVFFVIAFVYFMCWLSVGADMLWEWHCESVPGAGMCVRCGHTAAAHRSPVSCAARLGSLTLWKSCRCASYVPPGLSPKAADSRLPARSWARA